jgi:uncharacterized protein (DUF488 family)
LGESPATPGAAIVTVGHGTLDPDPFAELARGAGIDLIVDVRAYPGSRRVPQFGRDALAEWLPAAGVRYRWEPRLGGRRPSVPGSKRVALTHSAFRAYADYMETGEFRLGLDSVLADAANARVAVMCSESVWWRCHRRLIADEVVLVDGRPVEHLFHDGRRQPHPPMPEARVDGTHLVYDVDGSASARGQPSLW